MSLLTRKQKRRSTKRFAYGIDIKSINYKRLLAYISILSVLVGLGWMFRPSSFPVHNVKIFGNLHYLPEETVADIVSPHLNGGFFAVNVSNLRQQLVELPWVVHADVRRVWPGQVVIRIKEHIPAAFWQDSALLSQDGVLFSPESLTKVEVNMPRLYGPSSQHHDVWTQYLLLDKHVSPLGLHIVRCEMASRGAWQIQLSNGIIVVLGTQDIFSRLKRFVTAYQKLLHTKQNQIDYVDLRYTSGMSVGWRQG